MPNRPHVIESFCDLPGTVEIIGLGAARQPTGDAQEVEIAVLVASNMDVPTFDAQTNTHVRWVGCGQLELLAMGSRWQEGEFVGQAPGKTITGEFAFVAVERLGEGVDPPPPGNRRFPSRAINTAPGFLLKFQADADEAGKKAVHGGQSCPELIFLPQTELLRALFGVNTSFLLEMFDGIRNPAVSGERGLVNRKLSYLRDDETVVLEAARKLSDDEALIAAAIIADPALRELHDSVFQQLSVKPEQRAGARGSVTLKWPWEEPVSFELTGRWVKRVDNRWRFIALNISAMGMPLPFRRVEVRHPGAEPRGGNDLPPPEGRLKPPNASVVVLTTARGASSSRRPLEIATAPVNLTEAEGIEIVSVPKGGKVRGDRGYIGEDPRDEGLFGTGGRQAGADPNVGAAGTKRKRVRVADASARSQTEALDLTWKALYAACRENGWQLDALPRGNHGARDQLHGGLNLSREPLVARVLVGHRRLLIVDHGSPAGYECTLGILIPRDSGSSDQALASAARKACEGVGGRWRSSKLRAFEFRVIAINRAIEVWDNQGAYVDLLKQRISSAVAV